MSTTFTQRETSGSTDRATPTGQNGKVSAPRPGTPSDVELQIQVADRLDGLADVAELMDDDDGAVRLRRRAAEVRAAAMASLDE